MSQEARGAALLALHQGEPFLIPNPWDAGRRARSRRSAFLHWRRRAPDSRSRSATSTVANPRRRRRARRALASATRVPLSVDLENGYGHAPEDAAAAITRVAEAGAVGGSIEDFGRAGGSMPSIRRSSASRRPSRPRGRSVFRSSSRRAPRTTCAATPISTTRSPACRRSSGSGPTALRTRAATVDEIHAVCAAVGKPVNVLADPSLTVGSLRCGAQRISVGGGCVGRRRRTQRPPSRCGTRGASRYSTSRRPSANGSVFACDVRLRSAPQPPRRTDACRGNRRAVRAPSADLEYLVVSSGTSPFSARAPTRTAGPTAAG